MNRRISIGVLTAMGLLLPTFEGPAAARSVSAAMGGTVGGLLAFNEMSYNYSTGAVLMLEESGTSYFVPLTTDRSGTKTVTFTGRAVTAQPDHLQSRCYAYAWDRFGGSLSVSSTQVLPVSSTFQSRTLDSVVVPSMGAFAVSCILRNGTELMEFDHSR